MTVIYIYINIYIYTYGLYRYVAFIFQMDGRCRMTRYQQLTFPDLADVTAGQIGREPGGGSDNSRPDLGVFYGKIP